MPFTASEGIQEIDVAVVSWRMTKSVPHVRTATPGRQASP